jgi:hypothetical protein
MCLYPLPYKTLLKLKKKSRLRKKTGLLADAEISDIFEDAQWLMKW